MAGGVKTINNYWPSCTPHGAPVWFSAVIPSSGADAKWETGRFDDPSGEYHASGWEFDGWSVSPHGDGGAWVRNGGDITTLYSESHTPAGGEITFWRGQADDIEHDDALMDVVAVWKWTGAGPEQTTTDKITVTTTTTGDGSGTTYGDGEYKKGSSYTVSVTVDEGSALEKWTNSLDSIVWAHPSRTAIATADVTWTADIRKVYKVRIGVYPAAGGVIAMPAQFNCAVSFVNSLGTGSHTPSGMNSAVTYYKYKSGSQCQIDITPSESAHVTGERAVYVGIISRDESVGNIAAAASVSLSGFSQNGNRISFTVQNDVQLGILYMFPRANIYVKATDDAYNDMEDGGTTPDATGSYNAGDTVSATAISVDGYRFDGWDFQAGWGPNGASSGDSENIVLNVPSGGDVWSAVLTLFGPSGTYGKFMSRDYRLDLLYQAVFTVSVRLRSYDGHGRIELENLDIGIRKIVEGSEQIDRLEYGRPYYVSAVADQGYFVLGVVRVSSGSRAVIYLYQGSGAGYSDHRLLLTLSESDQSPGASFDFDLWVWPVPTGQILYSPDNGGAILCRSDGKPMAQYVG